MKRDPSTSIRPYVDFNYVEQKHLQIHARLENWARSCFGGGGTGSSPMFRLYRSDEHREGLTPTIPVDQIDASKIAKAVAILPRPHAWSIGWCYVRRTSPRRACQEVGTSLEGLALYIRDGRQMLLNRRI
jgi:hypothetical protein